MKKEKIILILLIITIPFILYLANFKSIAFDEIFYKKEFSRYNIYDDLPDADGINSDLLHYLRYDKTDNLVDIEKFNQREKEHLLDVKAVIQKSLLFLNLMIILAIVLVIFLYKINKKQFKKNVSLALIWGGAITFADAFFFTLLVKVNFDFIFGFLHKMFFKAGTWLFDSSDKLIMLYQEQIFYDVLFRIVLNTLVMAVLVMVLGFVLNKTKKYINTTKKQKQK